MEPNTTKPILLAIDGEPHTEQAVRRALEMAAVSGARVVAVHVKDPYLKQFANEIYAQGREEYLEHVEGQLAAVASEAVSMFENEARERGVEFDFLVVEGDTLACLRREIESGRYGALLLGGESRRGFGAWRAHDLSRKLSRGCEDLPIMLIPVAG